ncbi:MAG: M56 family metallopeptidase [Bacillota bacterium]
MAVSSRGLIPGLAAVTVLLPAALWASLSSEQRRHVVAHELAHLKRKDILANWLGTVFEVLHWFSPVIWFALTEMRQDCETACDATSTLSR